MYERQLLKAQILQIVLKCVRALARIVGRALGGGTFMHQAQKKATKMGCQREESGRILLHVFFFFHVQFILA